MSDQDRPGRADTSTATVEFSRTLLGRERRQAILAVGERKGLWTYHAVHDNSYLVEQNGTSVYLTATEVDQLPFEYFVNDGRVNLLDRP